MNLGDLKEFFNVTSIDKCVSDTLICGLQFHIAGCQCNNAGGQTSVLS